MKKSKKLLISSIVSAFVLCGASVSLTAHLIAEGEEENTNPYSNPPEGYTRYEAEDCELVDCAAKGKVPDSPIDYGTYSGLGFVGSIDNDDSSLTFTISVSKEGNYPVYVGYAIGEGFANAGLNVEVNGTYFQTWAFKQKNGWGTFASTVPLFTSINLANGINKVKLQRSYNYVEIDYLDIGPYQGENITPTTDSEIAKIPDGYTRYEAENGEVQSGKIYKVIGTCSGTGYVGELDYAGSSQLTFTVTVASEAEYNIRIAYAIGAGFGDAAMKIYNNDGFYNTVTFTEKNGWGVFDVGAIAVIGVSLRAGVNKLTFAKSSEYAQIDFIDVSNEPIGEWKATGYVVSYPNQVEGYTRYEAENGHVILGETKGIGYFLDMGHYSGLGFVGSLDKDSYYVEIPVKVAEDGEYAIRVAYACFEVGASLKLYTGQYGRGGQVYFQSEQVADHAEGWGEFTADTIFETTVSIKANKGYILVRSGFTRCEIDYIDLGAKVGDYKQGELCSDFDRYNY